MEPHQRAGVLVEPLSRRGFIQSSVLGLVSVGALPQALALSKPKAHPKSLLVLWLQGGPSQLETWDPHPGTTIGGPTRAIKTPVPGLEIAHGYPRVAEQIHHMSVVRSLTSREGDHERATYYLKTGYRPDPTVVHPALGAVYSHDRRDEPSLEIPGFISLGGGQWPGRGGYLGATQDAFKVYDPGKGVGHLDALVSNPQRETRRLDNLRILSSAFKGGREAGAAATHHDDTVQRALRMMRSEQVNAFRVEEEPDSVRAGYGDTQFGRCALAARRLIERGVPAVEVTLRGFDTHADNFSSHDARAAELDPALAMLISDLHERELLSRCVVLCIGEFGRTPKINVLEGRDHWNTGFSCLIGGGGLRAGAIIGETDPTGEKREPSNPVTVPDLAATILTALGLDVQHENYTPVGRPLKLSDGNPLRELL